jgi:hypothetical protein
VRSAALVLRELCGLLGLVHLVEYADGSRTEGDEHDSHTYEHVAVVVVGVLA